MNEHELRDRLHTLAERTAPPDGDARAWASDAACRDRAGRRRSWAAASLVAATVVAVLVTVLAVAPGSGGRSTAAPPTRTALVFGLDVRGSLAADSAFLAGVRQLSWEYDGSDVLNPPVTDRKVVYAGDVPGGGRWAVVIGSSSGLPAGDVGRAWFAGPEGARVDQMVLTTQPGPVPIDQPEAYLSAESGSLLVLAAPGDTIQVSPRPTFTASGASERTWRDETSTDGTALTTTNGAMLFPAVVTPVQYRVIRDGTDVITTMPRVWLGADGRPEAPLDTAFLDVDDGSQSAGLEMAARSLLTETGLRQDEVTFDVPYSGPVDGVEDPNQLQVLTATTPAGAVLVTASLATGSVVDVSHERCLRQAQPAGPRPFERTYAMDCPQAGLIVVTPAGSQWVESFTAAGELSSSGVPVENVYSDGGATGISTVRVTGADGTTTTTAVGGVDDLFD